MVRLPKVLVLGLLAVCLALAGCSDRSKVVGEWLGDRPTKVEAGKDPTVAGTLATVKLTMNRDGSFVLTEEGFDKSGRAVADRAEWVLKIDRILDRPVASLGSGAEAMAGERQVTPQPDGTLLFSRPGYPGVTLRRREGSS
jgi:uncharacterized lipoprotein NlpE involved in copper resistance